jgi:hypothetical protein
MMTACRVCPSRACCCRWKRGKAADRRLCLDFSRGLQAEKKLRAKNNFLPPVWSCWWGRPGPSSAAGRSGAGRAVRTRPSATQVLAPGRVRTSARSNKPETNQQSNAVLSRISSSNSPEPSSSTLQYPARKMEGLLFNVNNGYAEPSQYALLSTLTSLPSPPPQLHRGHRPRLPQWTAHQHQLHQHDTMREHRW